MQDLCNNVKKTVFKLSFSIQIYSKKSNQNRIETISDINQHSYQLEKEYFYPLTIKKVLFTLNFCFICLFLIVIVASRH